jgi:hypothetical protein
MFFIYSTAIIFGRYFAYSFVLGIVYTIFLQLYDSNMVINILFWPGIK